jgi:hypothetical protein
VAGRLTQAKAHEAADRVVTIIREGRIADGHAPLIQALASLTNRLNPEEAQKLCAVTVASILRFQRLEGLDGYYREVAVALLALSKHLNAKEADGLYTSAAARVLDELERLQNEQQPDREALKQLLSALAELAQFLETSEAVKVARRLVKALDELYLHAGSISYAGDTGLAGAFMALSQRMGEQEASAFAGLALADTYGSNRYGWYTASMTEGLVQHLRDQRLVDLLKSPFCVCEVRQAILAELGKRTGQTFRSRWDFVNWAAANRPDLDLTSPYCPPAE